MCREGLAQIGHYRVLIKTLDGGDFGATARDRQGETGPGRRAVDLHRTGAADTVLATEMRSGQTLPITQEVAEVRARLHVRRNRSAVNGEDNGCHVTKTSFRARATAARRILRSAISPWLTSST